MLKLLVVMSMILVCCYCLESNDLLVEETRAKKKKKSAARLLGIILLLVFSKVAIFKAVSTFLLMTFFQKIFSVAGVFLKYYLGGKDQPSAPPAPVYGAPQEYNTVGYSYGPPENQEIGYKDGPYPGIAEFGDWLLNKKV